MSLLWSNGPQAANPSALAGFTESDGEHVFYISTDQHVHQLYNYLGSWNDQDLTTWAGSPLARSGSGLTSFVDFEGEHAFYVSPDAHLHRLFYFQDTGGPTSWADEDLTSWANGPQAATGNGLIGFADKSGEHLFYIGSDLHVHQIYLPTTLAAPQ